METLKGLIKRQIGRLSGLRNVNRKREIVRDEAALNLHSLFIKGETESFETVMPIETLVGSHSGNDIPSMFEGMEMERTLTDYIKDDNYPIPVASDREGYFGDRHEQYWLSGLKDYLLIKGVLARHGCPLRNSPAIFELGCASGRVLRHFLCHEQQLDVWGADINIRHVEWIRRFLGEAVKVFPNTVLPHLPVEDNSFSLVYAFSVFTHIDELEIAWVVELRRILQRGGIAYLTIHSDHTWRRIQSARPLYDNLLALRDVISGYDVTPDLFTKPMPKEKTVFRWSAGFTYNSNVFHSTDYIKKVWGRYFEVVDIIRDGHNYQDVVVLRKKLK